VARAPLFRLAALFILILAARSSGLEAQGFGPASASRHGFWIGGGLGQGHTLLSCGICGGDERSSGGLTGSIRAGATLSPRLLLGAEVAAWRGSGTPVGERVFSGTVAGWYYPNPDHGWYLKLGAGWSDWKASEDNQALASGLFALSAGTGYEMRVNPVISVVPFVQVLASPAGNLNREIGSGADFRAERVATDFRLFLVQVGVGLVRH
jgi:hypothetical protein